MSDVAIVDYGVGNLLSVWRAIERCGGTPSLVDSPEGVLGAERLLLPGVGAFGDAMEALDQRGLVEPIREFASSGRPFLGICLGMELMLDSSEEFGHSEGLGLVPGRVVPIPAHGADRMPHKIPHIGWNELRPTPSGGSWEGTLLAGIRPGDSVYFVHSFMAVPDDDGTRLADCDYDGVPIAAVLRDGAMSGCQFHPEKSGPIGLAILGGFVALEPAVTGG
jgi:imidazole glycerol-phosphate synthase subunit HisH